MLHQIHLVDNQLILATMIYHYNIADKLLNLVESEYTISVTGHFNKRNQLVIESMQLETQIILRDQWAYK